MKLAGVEVVLTSRNRTRGKALLVSALALAVCAGSGLQPGPSRCAVVPRSAPAGAGTPADAAAPAETISVVRLDNPTPRYEAKVTVARTFVAMGDSLTAWAFAPGSWYASRTTAWPEVLSGLGSGFELLRNAGVPGNTTAQMVARFRSDVLAHHPDVVFILGGTNDVGKHIARSVTVANLRTMARLARDQGIEVVLMTLPPNNVLYPGELRALRATNAALVKMAGEEGFEVVDLYAVLVNSSGRLPAAYAALDGLHLTTTAEQLIAQTIAAELRPESRRA